MRTKYNIGSGAIETVYTYEEWLKEYKRQETKRRTRQRAERLYYMRQRISGAIMVVSGIVMPFLLDGDATVSLIIHPLGICMQ